MSETSISSESRSDSKAGFRGAPRISVHVPPVERGDNQEELLRREERQLILLSGSEFRQFVFELVESRWFGVAILLVIFLNTTFIAIQTSEYVVAKSEWYLMFVDQVFLAVYITELSLKLYVWRLRFFKQSWNIFDFAIVFASLVEFFIPLIVQNIGVFDPSVFRVLRVFRAFRALRALRVLRTIRVLRVFRAFRALRALRVLRTIRFLKNLQIIVATVLQSIPALGSIVLLISLVLYVFAIIGRGLYGEVDPGRFGNLAKASFTLFQLITLDDWFYMYSDIRDKHPDHQHILLYLILFIILETFIFINLFVAVIVDNLARTQAAANSERPKQIHNLHEKNTDHDSDTDVQAFKNNRRLTIVEAHVHHTMDDYYSQEQYSEKERELMGHYLMLLASLEHHLHAARNHQNTLNELVDLVDFSKT